MSWTASLQNELVLQHQKQAYRTRTPRHAQSALPDIHIDGQDYLNFGSNDYLGLSRDPEIISAWQQALAEYGTGSGGSPLVTGHTHLHQQFEQELAGWLGYSRALLFPSGYAANQAVLLGLLKKNDVLIADKYCHASMQEAAMSGSAQYRRFPHQNHAALEQQLNQCEKQRILVASEGVFSMDGDITDIGRLKKLCRQHHAWLIIDDAHGIGVLGREGMGSTEHCQAKPDILIVTFGKAFGLMGAAILCNDTVAEYLTQFARHLIYSTAVPPAQAVALSTALCRIRQGDELRKRLTDNIRYFQTAIIQAGLAHRLLPSSTPIQPVLCGDNGHTLKTAALLRANQLYIPAIRPPTVPNGQARLRITLTAAHEHRHIDTLVEGLIHAFHATNQN
ncbi:8-amino-7-oxononanoate synthase [Neisseria weaveri]|uniref:8-amino-7-oxononanoate synthase n=1 Tax=Neisseria weaveri TaxID=28091 RepID=UPI000D2FC666|nr:8-amino-7-oxononanoate synthase [Neisseria weaveri]